jgi:hypothetical protein
LFAGGTTKALAVDGDGRPAVVIGLVPQPSADRRLEGVDVDRPKDLRERALGGDYLKRRAFRRGPWTIRARACAIVGVIP